MVGEILPNEAILSRFGAFIVPNIFLVQTRKIFGTITAPKLLRMAIFGSISPTIPHNTNVIFF